MSPPQSWRRHRIEPLGFSVELVEGLPVESWQRPGGGGVFQPIAGTDGSLFVHWGESASFEAFRESLTDFLTREIEVAQEPVEVLGLAARRISATVERGSTVAYKEDADGGVTHVESPAARYRTEAISFVREGVPVLVGYRVPEPGFRRHQAVLRHFLASIRGLDG